MATVTIAYITETSPDDRHAWSGTAHYVYRALQQAGFEVVPIGPAVPGALKMVLGGINKFSLKVTGRRLDYRHSTIYSRAFARIFRKKLKKTKYDCIVVCGGTEYGAFLNETKPVYYVLDRTIAGAINYHLILQDLWPFSRAQSITTDRRAMAGSRHLFFSSKWAADHARVHYGIPAGKISVIPFGANIDLVPMRETALRPKAALPFRLLFIGSSWINKGGDIAYNTLKILLEKGLDVSLTVVGCRPPDELNAPWMTVIPFVDKNDPEGMQRFYELLSEHHLLILPTRFDCTPIVFCEASAFGLPVLSAETGGVAAHVKEEVNGFLLPFGDKGQGYAHKIELMMTDPEKYNALRSSARAFYESTLNWQTWGERVATVIRQRFSSER